MTKLEKSSIKDFDPSAPAMNNNIFGLPFSPDDSDTKIIVIGVPWGATVSYGSGAEHGPHAILKASKQVDLADFETKNAWAQSGIAMVPIDEEIYQLSRRTRKLVEVYLDYLSKGDAIVETPDFQKQIAIINENCEKMVVWVKQQTDFWIRKGKFVIVLGGDHSTPLGYLQALAYYSKDFSILQIDAHMDLRQAYEGFTYSHASIMWNALTMIDRIKNLVQVGIRDYGENELAFVDLKNRNTHSAAETIKPFFYRNIERALMTGQTWAEQVKEIIAAITETKVYLSFDIDGLDPTLCPNTGTPVPGGLTFEQALYLIEEVAKKKTIIGVDINEVAPGPNHDEWDASIGARLLYRIATIVSAKF